MQKPILIIKTGSTFPELAKHHGDFEDWIMNKTEGANASDFLVINVVSGNKLPEFSEISAILITGSHAMVTEYKDWMIYTVQWLRESFKKNILTLGICFGHQLLARALGGKVEYNPRGREIGTVKITTCPNNDRLFYDTFPAFLAYQSHYQSVETMPGEAKILAFNDHDPFQAYVYKNCIWGVQFHPEFDEQIMRFYINKLLLNLQQENFNINEMLNNIRPTPVATGLLTHFIRLVLNDHQS